MGLVETRAARYQNPMLNQIVHGTPTDRPPLLIAHGLYGSARNWGVIARRLSMNDRLLQSICAITGSARGPISMIIGDGAGSGGGDRRHGRPGGCSGPFHGRQDLNDACAQPWGHDRESWWWPILLR